MISFEKFNSWLTTYKEIIEKEEKVNNDLQ